MGRALQTHLPGGGAAARSGERGWQVRGEPWRERGPGGGEPRRAPVPRRRRSSSASPRDVSLAPARERWWWWGMSALLILFARHLLGNGLRLGVSRRAPSEPRKGSAPSARRGRGAAQAGAGAGLPALEPSAHPSPLVLSLPLPFQLCPASCREAGRDLCSRLEFLGERV